MEFKEILERKIKHYGKTEAAYEFAAEEYSNILIKEAQTEPLTLYGVVARLLKNYNCDTLQIEIDEETKGVTVTKCTLSEDYYADYDYEHLEELMP
jgi:hypothetical protein